MNRAEYGKHIIDLLSKQLSSEFGPGFSSRYLRSFRQFYLIVPNYEIWKSRFPNLQWTHIFRSLRVSDPVAVRWYLETASNEMWSVRTLSRNIGTQYYERHFKQPLLPSEQNDTDGNNAAEIIKSPIIAEFLGFKQDESFSESDLESAIITHLQEFIMELGRGFAFVKRQQLIRTDADDYFVDLVFYNIVLKCYVLIDLKLGKITHQDVGQMDMYVRMYDEMKRTEGDNPTIGKIIRIGVDKNRQRQNIGTQLISTLLSRMKEMGVKTAHLTVDELNAPARAFYTKNGFTVVERREVYFYPNKPRLLLQKTIE